MFSLEEIIKEVKTELQAVATDDVIIRREIVRKIVEKASDLLSVGVNIIPVVQFDNLDIQWEVPGEISGSYPVAPGASPGAAGAVTWSNKVQLSLQKYMCEVIIYDESVIRGLNDLQTRWSLRRAAEDKAKKKDYNILSALHSGAGQTVAATATWDNANATPETDITEAIGKILDNSNISENEIQNIHVVVPTKVWSVLLKLQSIHNIQQTLRDYFEKSYGIRFWPSRSTAIGNDALVVVKSEQTAVHGVLRPAKIPGGAVEEVRLQGIGRKYVITDYFNTVVIPDTAGGSTSSRICKITGVKS